MNTVSQSQQITRYDPERDTRYLNYFNLDRAIADVFAHIDQLPSSQTPEKHTRRVYESGLDYWRQWSGDVLPTANLMKRYIAHLRERGLKSSTISSRYMSPLRLLLNALATQPIDTEQLVEQVVVSPGTSEAEFMKKMQARMMVVNQLRNYISDCREHIEAARAIKPPRNETTSNVSPLWQHGKRLTIDQVNAVLRQMDRASIIGKRNYAIMRLAFESALRVAEIRRITLDSITQEGDIWLITVRGKRNNIDPVSVSPACIDAIYDFVDAFNDALPADSPRRIAGDMPIWQPIGNWSDIADGDYNTSAIDTSGIRRIIRVSTERVCGKGHGLAAHDTRRTAAAVAYNAGMPIAAISTMLRHKSSDVTMRYIGKAPDHESSTLANYVNISD
ncbi:site-specific integrase [Phototrophicus methaneseepsis]|uniref:Site-specific integrase n=1 Tax=Phototrophicus methaneseepsis TaxID=2710758 RepID=A0A7S8E646_9CHLR|nr:tyrosine-type recombinase/integrase [Phototrophicus methaneseepsis]QPC81084.1 site-specific integrase [Phototrophicus methaneseepsis]